MVNESYVLPIESVVQILVPSVFIVIIVCGLLGNLLVILVFLINRALQDSTNMLIISLALADLLFIILCVPFTAVQYALNLWPFVASWCRLMVYFQHVSALASVWTLVLMALDRFLAVVFPIHSLRYRTLRNTFVMCFLVWFLILLTNLPLIWLIGVHDYSFYGQNRSLCVYLNHIRRTASVNEIRWFYWSFSFGAYIIPLTVTCVLYGFLIRSLWKGPFGIISLNRDKRIRGDARCMRNTTCQDNLRNKKRVTLMVALVTVTFAVCWLSQNIRFLCIGALYPNERSTNPYMVAFQILAQVLAYLNSCLNPVIYGISSENFRRGFQNVIRVILRKEPRRISRKATLIPETSAAAIQRTAFCSSLPAVDSETRLLGYKETRNNSFKRYTFTNSRPGSGSESKIAHDGFTLNLYGNCVNNDEISQEHSRRSETVFL